MERLNKEDANAIRQRMQTDTQLAEAVKLRREMIYGVEAFGRKALKEQLKGIHEEVIHQPAPTAKRRPLFPILAAVAAVLLLLLMLPWLIDGDAQSPDELYAAYFEHHLISLAQRDAVDPNLLTLEKLYNDKNYQDALDLFETYLNGSIASNLLLGAGISYLETGQPEKARPLFNQIIDSKDFNYADQARWYGALAALKLNDATSAKSFLQPLVEDKSADHHEEAMELLRKLN